MLTNNILLSMNRNREALSIYEQQLASGKKIQKPSDDPILAIRALKFRTNVNEIEQYKTNAEDAKSWMTVTEQAVSTSTEILQRMRELCNQAATGTNKSSIKSIISELTQLKSQLVNESNVSYVGRYVFSGYKTDKPLTFLKDSTDEYEISESFTKDDIEKTQRAFNDSISDVYRIRLGYKGVKVANPASTIPITPPPPATTTNVTVTTKKSTDDGAYSPPPNSIFLLEDTGELIFNKDDISNIDNFEFKYDKNNFKKEDLVPYHYFKCKRKLPAPEESYELTNDEMQYRVSFNQEITVNTIGRDMVQFDAIRDIEELIDRTLEITGNGSTDEKLKKDLLTGLFSKSLGKLDKHIDKVLDVRSEIGGKVNRINLTVNRLGEDFNNFTDLLSSNEDIDIAEVMVKMKAQEMIYNASLMSSSKIIQPSLLDFIR
jgi:flagellar hook-associated protein 3 FlgL